MGNWVEKGGESRKMGRIGPIGMKICLYYVVLHGESIGKGPRVVRAQKRGVLSEKLGE